ncbi:MAG TPA: DUF4410 domain-containing protein [Candidatus Binatia bacterium]|jgi:hypothetical protein
MPKLLFVIFFATLLSACSTQNISTSPATNLKLVGDSVFVKVTGSNIEPKVLDRLTREIKGQLIIAGFDLEKETDKKLYLNVAVTAFSPGNAALRLTVGFGAGRGSLLYTAEYTNQAGQTLAKMEGQERFTGAEIGFELNYGAFTTMGGEDTATEVLVKEAGKHIIELALKGESK